MQLINKKAKYALYKGHGRGKKRMREMRSNAYLLHFILMQSPFHLLGRGPKPSSLKDLDSGQIPVSNIPIITSLSNAGFRLTVSGKRRKSQDLVVWGLRFLLGKTDTTPSIPSDFITEIKQMG